MTTSNITTETCATFTMFTELCVNIPSKAYPMQQGNYGLFSFFIKHYILQSLLVPTYTY